MGSHLLLLFLLMFKTVLSAPFNSTDSFSPEQSVTISANQNGHSNRTLGGCSESFKLITDEIGIALPAEARDDESDANEQNHSTTQTSPGMISTEALTNNNSPTTTNVITNIRDDEQNSTDTTAVADYNSVEQNETLNFRSDMSDLSNLTTTEHFSAILEKEFISTSTLVSEKDQPDTELESLLLNEDSIAPEEEEENEKEKTVSEIPSTTIAEISTAVESLEGQRISDKVIETTSRESVFEIENGPTASSPVSENSTIREISIILLPLEEREEILGDSLAENIGSLLDIGGSSFEAEELRNSSQGTKSVETTSDPVTETIKLETIVFNAPKIPSKLKSTTKVIPTTEAKITTPVAFSTSAADTSTMTQSVSTDIVTESVDTETASVSQKLKSNDSNDEKSTSESVTASETTTAVSTPSTVTTDSVTTTTSAEDTDLTDDSRYISGNITDMVSAVQFLHYHDKASSEQCYKLVNAHWNYATNLTEENKKKQLAQTLEYSQFHKEAWKNATSFAWKSFNDTLLRRWFKSLSVLGTAALSDDTLTEFNKLKAEMKNVYSTAKICGYHAQPSTSLRKRKCDLSLEPDLQRIMTKSRDYEELVHVWKSWRDAAGKPIREKFLKFVEISNEAAHLNGFRDTGDMWRESYESSTFREDLAKLWEQLRPLYEHLHAYVRRRLINLYGTEKIKENGPIPAHLFGNMWAQSWVSLLDICQPYPGKPSVDVTATMEENNMTALDMFKISEEFFTSLGLKAMPEEFWKHSLIEKPKDREIICHASAWDFCNGKDYRIKQCTDITMEDLVTVHHEMGHIQYFLQYARQPNVFREGANPGFHEAIGDVLALSVSTPKHLKSIGLLQEVADDPEGDLNFLLRTALEKVSFLPSGYLIDLWRWGLFSGEIVPEEMNAKWWELRLKYQGICPPVKRTETDFDPGAKYHIPGNVPYIRYFVSFVIQFQFHKVLCDAAGHTGLLHKCDIYRSKEAGQILSQVMELGSSEHWSEAMKIMTGGATNKMDASPILEYFGPLLDYLIEQNRNETIGWKSLDPTICP